MSLINDALKRAQEAQRKQSPPPMTGAPLHSTSRQKSSMPWILAVLVVFALLIAIVGKGLLLRTNKSRVTNEKIASTQKQNATQPVAPKKIIVPTPPQPVPVKPVVVQTPVTNVPEVVIEKPAIPTNVAPPPAETNPPAPVAAVEMPQPTDLQSLFKLQGIFYRPNRPSAVINGRALFNGETLFVNERVGSARVIAITPDSATVVLGGQTNVLRTR